MLKNLNQKGSVLQLLVAVLFIAAVVAGYFILNLKTPEKIKAPSPLPSASSYQSQKLEEYDKNKEEIKAKLNLTEQEFQILKRYSAD